MKNMLLIALLVFSFQAHAGKGWEGSKVKIQKGALLCDYSSMETGLILQEAGDKGSLAALVKKGRCLYAPDDFFATVIKDASEFTEPNLAQIMIEGFSIWGAMKDMDCCYE